MPRLFIALDFPESINDQLLEICELGMMSASWVSADRFHLTLQFIGEVDGGRFEDIRMALSEIQMPAFALALKGVGFFPPRKQPRVLWAGVEKNEALYQLKKKIDYQLARLKLPLEKRKFHPHITLARLKKPSSDQIGMYLSQHNLFKTSSVLIEDFILYSSVLSSQGAIHTPEATYALHHERTPLSSINDTGDR